MHSKDACKGTMACTLQLLGSLSSQDCLDVEKNGQKQELNALERARRRHIAYSVLDSLQTVDADLSMSTSVIESGFKQRNGSICDDRMKFNGLDSLDSLNDDIQMDSKVALESLISNPPQNPSIFLSNAMHSLMNLSVPMDLKESFDPSMNLMEQVYQEMNEDMSKRLSLLKPNNSDIQQPSFQSIIKHILYSNSNSNSYFKSNSSSILKTCRDTVEFRHNSSSSVSNTPLTSSIPKKQNKKPNTKHKVSIGINTDPPPQKTTRSINTDPIKFADDYVPKTTCANCSINSNEKENSNHKSRRKRVQVPSDNSSSDSDGNLSDDIMSDINKMNRLKDRNIPKLRKDDNETKFSAGRLRNPVDSSTSSSFITGAEKMQQDNATKNNGSMFGGNANGNMTAKRALGSSGRRSFVPPLKKNNSSESINDRSSTSKSSKDDSLEGEKLLNIPDELAQTIANEIIHTKTNVAWDDIIGLENAKKSIMEIVVWPMLRPDLFSGIRGPCKGLLLFGPPGTGKTLIGKCIASQSKATFFSISSSSLTSKWVGEGEKLVRALFAMASLKQPSVIFIDEIDSLLTQRSEGEIESTRRIKTEFLVQFDGCGTKADDRVLVIGATNRPQELDEAARRRFRKKLYIPLPSPESRKNIIRNLMKGQLNLLSEEDLDEIVKMTDGYSGSDMDGLIREAALGPIREITDINGVSLNDVRGVNLVDFKQALRQVRKSVGEQELKQYEKFVDEFGSSGL